MKKLLSPIPILTLWVLLVFCPALAESTGSDLTPYIRYTANRLDTAVVTMQNDRGQQLDLISAVHVASPAYYADLNQRFRDYDAVLYELVLPDEMVGRQLPSQMETGSGVSGMQQMIARSMGLTTQIERIDYSQKNFVHADLTHSGLAQKMAERQENLMAYMMKVLMSSGTIDEKSLGVSDQELAQLDMMAVMNGRTSARDRRILRKLFASSLSSSGGVLAALGDTALIAERNKAALKVADREVQSGKRRLALFYGAAHMPDLQAQLKKKGWRTTRTEWLKAWDI